MVNLNEIGTQRGGIKRMFQTQRRQHKTRADGEVPSDNQGIRFLIDDVRAGNPWRAEE